MKIFRTFFKKIWKISNKFLENFGKILKNLKHKIGKVDFIILGDTVVHFAVLTVCLDCVG